MAVKKKALTPKVAATVADTPDAVPMQVEMWSIHKLRPHTKNARIIGAKAIEKVGNSLTAFGWRQPIVVDSKGTIIAGHTRYLAAQKLGMVSVPVHVASDLDATRIRAYRLADNKTGEIARWQEDLLAEELAALDAEGVDMANWGFMKDKADEILEDMNKADAEAAESVAPAAAAHKCPSCGFSWDPKE